MPINLVKVAEDLTMLPARNNSLIHFSQPRRCNGISLIEILVTMFVMTIGLLGLAGLQSASLQFNNVANLRTVAIIQSYDMMDRMRANKRGLDQGFYDDPTATANADCSTTTGCTPEEMAMDDFTTWDALNASMLPSGKGFVCKEDTPDTGINRVNGSTSDDEPTCNGTGSRYVVYVTWTEEGETVTFFETLEP